MTNYQRSFVPVGSYFFTVNLADRSSRLLTDHVDLLRTAFRYARVRHAFMIDAIVILPDYLHDQAGQLVCYLTRTTRLLTTPAGAGGVEGLYFANLGDCVWTSQSL